MTKPSAKRSDVPRKTSENEPVSVVQHHYHYHYDKCTFYVNPVLPPLVPPPFSMVVPPPPPPNLAPPAADYNQVPINHPVQQVPDAPRFQSPPKQPAATAKRTNPRSAYSDPGVFTVHGRGK
ncbi:hypothetical protein VNI00_017486 [Paramarasmius palmivorus]|uniref:Uncharacterized protein n=1 Tax=Paramarasmius palmivorus TaxID=297713 RepID=A0AAW0B613_9AGAR